MKKIYYLILLISGISLAQPFAPSPYVICDVENDGVETFNLNSKDAEILGTLQFFTVTYHFSAADADNFVNILPSAYANIANPQTVYARVTNDVDSSDYLVYPMVLLASQPAGTISGAATACQNKNMEITFTGSGGNAPYTFSYAVNGIAVSTVTSFNNIATLNIAFPTIGFYEVAITSVSDSTGCVKPQFMPLNIEVFATPTAFQAPDMIISEDPYDGAAVFNIDSQIGIISNGQPNVTVSYYLSEGDAMVQINQILSPFINTTNPQLIYAMVRDNSTGCYNISTFNLIVTNPDIIYIPDANFKARLLTLGIPNPTALDTSGELLFIDANADGEIQYSEALQVGTLYIAGQAIADAEGLQFFTNLTYLDAPNNNLTTLDLSTLTNLISVECSFNDLVELNLGNINVIGIYCYNNNLTNLDITNLDNLQFLWCFRNELTSLDVSQNLGLLGLQFDFNQLTEIDLTGLNLGTLGCSHNLLTSLDVSQSTNLESMNCEYNFFTGLDLTNNTDLWWLSCAGNLFQNFDVSNLPLLTSLKTGGNLLQTLSIKNGISQELILEESPILEFICVDDSEAATVQAVVNANANPNTVVNSYCTFTPGGDYNTITGNIKFDGDNNGCNAADTAHPFVKMIIDDGTNQGVAFADGNGDFNFYTGAGTFTLATEVENPSQFNINPIGASVVFPDTNNNVSTNNFCITANGVHPDLEIVIAPITPARPGFDAEYKIVFKNKGNQLNNGMITFTYNDDVLDFLSAVPMQDNQAAGQLTFFYNELAPFENREILVTMLVNAPTDTPAVNIGDILDFTSVIVLNGTDETPEDNTFTFSQTVIGSYDPNDITCIEGDVVSPSEIGNYLHYIINFENTGTFAAQNIVVRDSINLAQFDIMSMQVLNSSHNVNARVQGNKAEFIFEDINLEIGGHGNILLKIKSNSTLNTGDAVNNRADIFFDYNFPVLTNTANTVFQSLSVDDNVFDDSISVYPNPSVDVINIKSDSSIQSIQLYDVHGRLLLTRLTNVEIESIDMSAKSNGIYFLKITTANGIKTEKIIKQ